MVCSLISLYTFIGFMYSLWVAPSIYSIESSPTVYPFLYAYWITKHIELLDTVFMILRHRQRQVSFLHVFHHSSMLLLSDYAVHVYPWTAIGFPLGLNSFVHVVLYFYYGLTSYDSSKAPPWKRRLTELQLLQFALDLVFAIWGYIFHGYCVYCFWYGISMITLFGNFYYRAYLAPKKSNVIENGSSKVNNKGHENGNANGIKGKIRTD